jgi:hypothetical protein
MSILPMLTTFSLSVLILVIMVSGFFVQLSNHALNGCLFLFHVFYKGYLALEVDGSEQVVAFSFGIALVCECLSPDTVV